MGSNVIQLADYLVPSYRRPRPDRALAPAARERSGSWSAMARDRAAEKRLAIGRESNPPAAAPAGVRVVRAAGRGESPSPDARLRISGRLIDVCAELERLAAAETAAQLPRRA